MKKLKPLKTIYLQNYCEDYLKHDEDVTWCEDKQSDDDIEYILQSEYDATIAQKDAEIERLREALREIVSRGYTGASYVAQKALEVNND